MITRPISNLYFLIVLIFLVSACGAVTPAPVTSISPTATVTLFAESSTNIPTFTPVVETLTTLLALTPFVFQRRPWALKLAFWIAALEIANGAGHLSAALFVRGYFPGVLAGIGLLVFGVWLVLRARMERV